MTTDQGKILLTSVCRPLGPRYGDGPSVGYELLFGQVTRAQGLFSPRATHLHFSLEYLAENLETPTVVLQYPSRRELIRELRKGYTYVGISFILAVFHRMKETVALVRRYAPGARIILGGYGTILPDEVLAPYSDFICREEGVTFMRRILGEPPLPMPYKHPLIVSRLKIFSLPASSTGMIFAGLGCPHGCDFCCTSNFFGRKHIKLLPEGRHIYDVIERYLDLDPKMSFTILDEDFLMNKKRAMSFRDCVIKGGRPLSIFVFSSVKAISQYTVEEILEMGIDGFWIGYEGTRSGYAKQRGRPIEAILGEFREHGITILASMILGFDYQTRDVLAEELDGLMRLKPSLSQFLIYGAVPGTPFYDRIMREDLLREDLLRSPEAYYRSADGFTSMVKHPTLSPAEIEELQRWCFEEDFNRLGPSIYRVIETWLLGYLRLKDSPNPLLRQKADRLARDVRRGYPLFRAGRLLGPTPEIRRWTGELEERAYAALGPPTVTERLLSVAAVGAALATRLALKIDRLQHPRLNRTCYRMPENGWERTESWDRLQADARELGLSLGIEFQHAQKQVWLRLEGAISSLQAPRIAADLAAALRDRRTRLVLDIKRLGSIEHGALAPLRKALRRYRARIRLASAAGAERDPDVRGLARMFPHYRGL